MDTPIEIDVDDDFGRTVLSMVPKTPPEGPQVFYNTPGDCVEVLIANESFRAHRLDKLVTVYYGQESGEIVGWLIKGIRRFIQEMVETSPGFVIEVEGQRVKLIYVFTAGMWQQGDKILVRTYKELRDKAEEFDLEVELPCGA